MFFRRKHKREKISECFVECSSGRWNCNGQTLDISEGGMRVEMEEVPDMNEEIELFMRCESGRQLNKRAVVVWFIKKVPPEVGSLVGLKFI